MRRTALVRVAAATGVLLLASACGGSSDSKGNADTTDGAKPAAKAGATVDIPLLEFKPTSVTIKTGQTVTWVNGNDINHVLVQGTYKAGSDGLRTEEMDDKAFNLVVDKKGDTVEHTYDKAGSFTYFCTIHKGMNATVIVQ